MELKVSRFFPLLHNVSTFRAALLIPFICSKLLLPLQLVGKREKEKEVALTEPYLRTRANGALAKEALHSLHIQTSDHFFLCPLKSANAPQGNKSLCYNEGSVDGSSGSSEAFPVKTMRIVYLYLFLFLLLRN